MLDKTIGPGGFYIGIDAGSVSINSVVLSGDRELVYEAPYRRHFGKVEEEVSKLLAGLYDRFGRQNVVSVSFTGNLGKKLSEKLGAFFEFETISQVLGALFIEPETRTIISMGGQETALLQIRHYEGAWDLEHFSTNGPCASGTGSFIEQQAERLATSLYSEEKDFSRDIEKILADFIRKGLKSTSPSDVACRCTVFTKSDMIHLQNKGERLEDIIFGLHLGNARNYMSTIVNNRELEEPIVFAGGLSLNELQVKAFKGYFPALRVPEHSTSVGALGVALQALEQGMTGRPEPETLQNSGAQEDENVPRAGRLILNLTDFSRTNRVNKRALSGRPKVFLGIDIGSTTSKYALIDRRKEIIHKSYVHTQGRPVEVTKGLLGNILSDLGVDVEIAGVATTGSGRNVVGDFLNADLIIDEITAHAKGAVSIDPSVDTIFEIGGQDSKYISLSNTYPLDFDMNKVCAAGTGSFLHELANKYGINIVGEFEEIALSSESPVKLAERCTVFMESDLVSYLQKGMKQKDLIAGLCYAIVHNYLNRVVGKRRIGERVMFLGGPSLNKGVVAAFENVLKRGLIVPQHREVLGAYGAALSVQEEMAAGAGAKSGFRGLESAINDSMQYTEKVCKADPDCHNQCKLKIYDFDGRKSIWGGECGRYEVSRASGQKKENFFRLRDRIWNEHMDGVFDLLGREPLMEVEDRPTVGMQRALYGHQTSVLWAHFFDRLGMRLVLTPPTNPLISKAGIEKMVAETCYPVKISHGHVGELIGKTRYLFLPTMISMTTPEEEEAGFFCPLVQGNSYMIRVAMKVDRSSLLAPVIHLKHDPDTLAIEIHEQLGSRLAKSKGEIREALLYGLERHDLFTRAMYEAGELLLARHDPSEPLVVVTGRPYNLYDERLNLRLGQNLSRIGVPGIPMDFVDVSDVDLSDFPSMYWGLGAQILRTAKLIMSHPNYFGLHVTNFSCGADSFIEHFYKYIMQDKAFLVLELDEHSAVAGVMTRLEAYKNVINNIMRKSRADLVGNRKWAN